MTIDSILDLLQLIVMGYIALRLGTLSVDFKYKNIKGNKKREDYYNMYE